MQRIHAHITRDRQSFLFGSSYQFNPSGRGQSRQMHAGTRTSHQGQNGLDGNRLRGNRDTGQAHPQCQRTTRCHTATQVRVLGVQVNGVAKSTGVAQCALQHMGIGQTHLGLPKPNATRLGQSAHLSQSLTLQAFSKCSQGEEPGQAQLMRSVTKHLHQARFIQNRVRIRGANQARHATSHCRLKL